MDNIPLLFLMSLVFIAAGLLIYSFKSGSVINCSDSDGFREKPAENGPVDVEGPVYWQKLHFESYEHEGAVVFGPLRLRWLLLDPTDKSPNGSEQAVFKPFVGHMCHVTGTKQNGPPAGSPHIVVKTIKALDVDGLGKTF